MHSTKRPFAAGPLSTCIALAFPLASGAAMAQSTFQASGAYSIGSDQSGGGSQAKSGSFSMPESAGFVSGGATGGPAGRYDSTASIVATALGDGHFGGSTSALESYGSTSAMSSNVRLVYRDRISNTGSTAQSASFALAINSLAFSFDYGTQYGTNRVSFSAQVFVDGINAPVWASSFSYDDGLAQAGSGGFTASGVDIGLAAALPSSCPVHYGQGCSFYSGGFGISNYQTSVNLGTVAANDSLGIRYEVDLSTETNMYGGGATASFDDPARLTSGGLAAARLGFDAPTGPVFDGGNVAAVPEPESYALMAAGLGLVALARRRGRR